MFDITIASPQIICYIVVLKVLKLLRARKENVLAVVGVYCIASLKITQHKARASML